MATESVATGNAKTERKVLGTCYCLPDNMAADDRAAQPLLQVCEDASAAAAINMGMCLVNTAHEIAATPMGALDANHRAAVAYLLDIGYALLAAGAGEDGEIAEDAA